MIPENAPRASTADRRTDNRRSAQGAVRLTLAATELCGEIDNISKSGMLFFTDGELRVRVEYQEEGVTRQRSARLVRVQRMRADHTGWAIEFDD